MTSSTSVSPVEAQLRPTAYAQNLVVVLLDYDAQRRAAIAGLPAAALQLYPLPQELVAQAILLGASVTPEGHVHLAHNARWKREPGLGAWVGASDGARISLEDLDERPGSASVAIRLIAAARERQLEKIDADASLALDEALASDDRPYDDLVRRARSGRLTTLDPARLARLDAHLTACSERIRAKREAERQADEARKLASEAERQTKANAECARRLVRGLRLATLVRGGLATRLASYATAGAPDSVMAGERKHAANVLARLDSPEGDGPLGLLPEEEALELIRAAKLPELIGEIAEYQKILAEEVLGELAVEAGCDGECEKASFSSSKPCDLTAEEWAELQVIRVALEHARLPAGEVRLHSGTCLCSDVGDVVRRVGVKVKLDLGDGVVVEREYGVQ